MNVFALSGLMNAITAIGLGLLVYFHSPRDNRHWSFGLITLTTAVWGLGYWAWQIADTAEQALFFSRLLMAGAIFIPVTYLHHVLILTKEQQSHFRLLAWQYGLGIFFLLSDFTPAFVQDVQPRAIFSFWPTPGPLFHVFLCWWIGLAVYAHYCLLRVIRESHGLQKRQYLFLLTASGVGFLGGSTNFPLWYGIEILPYGTILFTLYVALIAYTLLRFHLLDFSVFVERGMSYMAILLLISQPAYPVLLFAQNSIFGAISYRYSMVQLFVHLMTVAGAYQMKVGTRGAIARTVFQSRQSRLKTVADFSSRVSECCNVQALGKEMVDFFHRERGIQVVVLYLLDWRTKQYVRSSSSTHTASPSAYPHFTATDPLPRHLSLVQSAVFTQELRHQDSHELNQAVLGCLTEYEADICVPLFNKKRLLGFCALGTRSSGRLNLPEEIQLLQPMIQDAAIALDNILLQEELHQSEALIHQMDRLRSMDILKHGLVEQLHNPVTSIKAFVQLAPLRKNDKEFLQRFQNVVSSEVHRLEQLTKELHQYSLTSAPSMKRQSINDILSSSLSLFTLHQQYQRFKLELHLELSLPLVCVDQQSIRQMFFNLMAYYCQANPDLEESIAVKSQEVVTAKNDRWIQVSIIRKSEEPPLWNWDMVSQANLGLVSNGEIATSRNQGLRIAVQILQRHQGFSRIEQDAAGIRFVSLILPAAKDQSPISSRHHSNLRHFKTLFLGPRYFT